MEFLVVQWWKPGGAISLTVMEENNDLVSPPASFLIALPTTVSRNFTLS